MINKKAKNNKLIIGLVGALVFVVTTLIIVAVNTNTRLIYIGNAEVEALLADSSEQGVFMYIGSPSCPVCNTFRPTVEAVLERMEAELYYFETDAAIAEDLERTRANLGRTASSTPTIIYLVNGEVIDSINSTTASELQAFFERQPHGLLR